MTIEMSTGGLSQCIDKIEAGGGGRGRSSQRAIHQLIFDTQEIGFPSRKLIVNKPGKLRTTPSVTPSGKMAI